MIDDPIIEELHRVREEMAAKFNYDVHAMFAYWRARELEKGRKVVSFELPKKEVQVAEEEMQDLAA